MSSSDRISLPSVAPQSRREQVANILRTAILSGELSPGQRLTETELSAQLGTSRAPVREAIRQLEQEGLVVSFPYRGTQVLGVSQEEIDEVLVPIRVTLETYAFRKSIALLDQESIARLRAVLDAIAAAAKTRDPVALADADIDFHEAVIELSDQQHCIQIWRSIKARVRTYFLRDAGAYTDPADVVRQHQELLDALIAGDEHKLTAAVETHIHTHGRLSA